VRLVEVGHRRVGLLARLARAAGVGAQVGDANVQGVALDGLVHSGRLSVQRRLPLGLVEVAVLLATVFFFLLLVFLELSGELGLDLLLDALLLLLAA
jgi:hypothetical protein